MSADDWASGERLQEAIATLRGLLLACEPRQREAFRQRHVVDGSGDEGDIERARRVLAWLLEALTVSNTPERWRQLARIIEVARLEQPASHQALDRTAPLIEAVDITLPAATELRPVLDGLAPRTESMDGTVALGDLRAADLGLDELGEAADSARRAPGGTLVAGKSPNEALDIERYAVLCAWSEVHPGRREALHAQYGIESETARAELDKQFEQRFRQDPRMRAAFAQRLKLHLSWLRR